MLFLIYILLFTDQKKKKIIALGRPLLKGLKISLFTLGIWLSNGTKIHFVRRPLVRGTIVGFLIPKSP